MLYGPSAGVLSYVGATDLKYPSSSARSNAQVGASREMPAPVQNRTAFGSR
jgi:hypothetical protein